MVRLGNILWCSNCRVPLLSDTCSICHSQGCRVASDVRPVFPEEKRLIEVFLGYPEGFLNDKPVWDTSSNFLLIDGETVPVDKSRLLTLDTRKLRDELQTRTIPETEREWFAGHLAAFVAANLQRLNEIEYDAFDIIEIARAGRNEQIPIVSFSGGKDSTVVSDLVRRAYANQSILHIFGDTTLELPETIDYVERFKKRNRRIPFLESRSSHSFMDLCKQIGPPSRVMRWCCTIFKTAPIGKVLDSLDKSRAMLTYYGIRRAESTRRGKYKVITKSPKVSRQTVVSPIIRWTDADVWLYIIARDLDFNDAYRLGFSRVGCWACPSSSLWSFFLTRIYHPELSEPWREYLIQVAADMGKPDPEEYVDSGKWKARQGGQGLKTAFKGIVTSRPCGDDPNAKTYTLTKLISTDLYEYFKPFGHIEFGRGRSLLGEVFVVDKHTQQPILVLQGRVGTSELRVKAVDPSNPTLLLLRVDCQIRKYQSCILCGGCPSACPSRAISDKAGRYTINEGKCTNCLKCVSHFDTGCLVSKVLQTRRRKEIKKNEFCTPSDILPAIWVAGQGT